jgi:MFS family permease
VNRKIRRRVVLSLLYFSEGAPIGYIWWAMPTRLREAGMPVEQVGGLIAMLTLPWAFKFLWAPAVDRLRGSRWSHRHWITVAQIAMGFTLLPLATMNPADIVGWATVLLMAHTFCAATQDVAIDAYAIEQVPVAERGATTGWMQAGMLVGRAIFGGVALAAESYIGAAGVVYALIASIWMTLAVLWIVRLDAPDQSVSNAINAREPLFAALGRALRGRRTWLGLGLALIAGAGFEAAGGLMGPMLTDRGATKEEIGWFLAIPVVTLIILGGLTGGMVADRLGHLRLVSLLIVLVAMSVGGIAAVHSLTDAAPPNVLMAAAAPMYFLIGSLTAATYALFMDLSDPAIGGTQFSAYMGATNMCEAWAIALAGTIAGSAGYGPAFAVAAILSLLAIAFTVLLAKHPVERSHT